MTRLIPYTRRKPWHRPEDRFVFDGILRKHSSKIKPSWCRSPLWDCMKWYEDDSNPGEWIGKIGTEAQRRASLRRIRPAAKTKGNPTTKLLKWMGAIGAKRVQRIRPAAKKGRGKP